MPQLFSPLADRRLRAGLVVGALGAAAILAAAFAFVRSDRAWGVGVAAPQPIPFSHAIHAGGIGLDCRYCHAGVEHAAGAGMPTAETCLGCHNEVWNVAAQFAPLHSALALGAPVVWSSVHRLPEHVRFHHAAHVTAGIACGACHGDVAAMPRTVKVNTLSMGWCLDCHRAPPAGASPAGAPMVGASPVGASQGGASQGGAPVIGTPAAGMARATGPRVMVEHGGVQISPLTRCSTCHR